jgi:dephospho-CoA kinase
MKIVGLTGGVGMGKSTTDHLIRERGIPVIDTDSLSRQLVEPGQPALAEIAAEFGSGVLDRQGRLDRRALGQLVFNDDQARAKLESILHPRIRRLWKAQVETWNLEGRAMGVVVIPLLFETRAEEEFDFTVCVACSVAAQKERLESRGWTSAQITQRIKAQLPIEQKISNSDFVLWNEAAPEVLAAQLDAALQSIRAG